MTNSSQATLIDELTTLVSRAAAIVLDIRARALAPRTKADQSPVTAADIASEAFLIEGLERLLPDLPIVSEEAGIRSRGATIGGDYALIDPVDGTRELVAGRDEFTINLGIVRAGVPALGLIAAPALGLVWRTAAGGGSERLRLKPGAPAGEASERVAIRPRPLPCAGRVVTVSRSHLDAATEAFLGRIGDVTRLTTGSAIKLCHVAEGRADIYPRLGATHEWDLAAGHAILAAVGGVVTTPQRQPLSYRARDWKVAGFIAWGDPSAIMLGH